MILQPRAALLEAAADSDAPTIEDRPLSFGAALIGFILSTALTSTVLMLLSQS